MKKFEMPEIQVVSFGENIMAQSITLSDGSGSYNVGSVYGTYTANDTTKDTFIGFK